VRAARKPPCAGFDDGKGRMAPADEDDPFSLRDPKPGHPLALRRCSPFHLPVTPRMCSTVMSEPPETADRTEQARIVTPGDRGPRGSP